MKLIKIVLSSLLLLSSLGSVAQAGMEAPVTEDFVYMVTVRVKPEQVESFKSILVPYAEQTRHELGNMGYLVNQSTDDPTLFALVEHWRSNDGRADHLNQTYTKNFFAQAGAMFQPGFPQRAKYAELR